MTPNQTRAALIVGLVLGSFSVALAKDLKPTSFEAEYSMEIDRDEITTVPACAAASLAAFEDTRSEPNVGERFHEKTPNVKLPITMTGDPLLWMQTGFMEHARRAVLSYATEGRPEITFQLVSLWIDEQVYRNSEYDGQVVLDVAVTPAGGGTTCWSGRVSGFAENYGRAGKEVNYQETVNHALDKAMVKAFADAELTNALCTCGSTDQ